MKKYELVAEDTIEVFGIKLFRIRAVRDFGAVKAGDLGGYVESEENLSQDGKAWVSDWAQVFGKARVSDRAWVAGKAWVYGEARVFGDAWVYGKALVSGKARVSGEAQVSGEARVSGWEWQEVAPGVKVAVPTLAQEDEADEDEAGSESEQDTARSDDVLEAVRGARDSLDRLAGVLERSV